MKLSNEYSDYESLLLILDGLSYAMYTSNLDREQFNKYKQGILNEITDEEKKEVEILLLLEKLGYPMDELGTYLYKNLILEVVKYLSQVSTRQQIIDCKHYLAKLKDAFSNIYLDIARFELEIGIKKFHYYIIEALNKIEKEKVDKNLLKEIYGRINFETDYAEQAFILGCYYSGKYQQIDYQEKEEIKYPKIKVLSNMPNFK